MKVQKGEIITGWHVRNCLQSLIDSRHPCKVKIPHTPFCWDAWPAKIHRTEDSDRLFIDGVGGFEQALPPSQDRKITLKYSDAQVFFCRFHTGVIKTSPQGIWVEYPKAIYRTQRRAFHRVKAQGGTEIVFPRGAGKKVRARVRHYSLGGVAFTPEENLALKSDDRLQELSLRIPEEGDWFTVEIPLVVVRRVELPAQSGRNLYALEFIGLGERVKKRFRQPISETQRLLLRKFRKGPLLNEPVDAGNCRSQRADLEDRQIHRRDRLPGQFVGVECGRGSGEGRRSRGGVCGGGRGGEEPGHAGGRIGPEHGGFNGGDCAEGEESGELVGATAKEFGDVAGGSEKVRQLMQEIAAASEEQSQGIEQINKAVAEMNQVTQQNAGSAQELASTMGFFK